jgi:hypothetical protein
MMKKLIMVTALASVLAACGTTDPYTKRMEAERERTEKQVERALDKAPDWMTKLPESTDAVYANGTAVSLDMSMADEKAKVVAMGKICTAAGGTVDKQSRVFRTDGASTSNESSEMAIRSMCRQVDVTGVEIREIKRVSQGTQFRSYVLVALPMGDANVLKRTKVNDAIAERAAQRSVDAFKELDKQ